MAAVSPAPSNNSSDNAPSSYTTAVPATAPVPASLHTPPKTLRGLNKPKCIQCGNVARSRCPYQSCKSCCSRAQNPCHIHVLKSATVPDKTPISSAPVDQQQSTESSPAVNSLRVASLRQLSSNFSQFNNLQTSRSKKPMTKKEAAAINEWRFFKLKEYRDRNIEVENEAFDRYMQNVNLLEEVFSVESNLEGSAEDESLSSSPDHASGKDDTNKMILEQKLKLRSNPMRSENVRTRIKQIVEEGLVKLHKREHNGPDDLNDPNGIDERLKKAKSWWADTEKASAVSDLIDKLNKARNQDDLKSCMKMKAQLFRQPTTSGETETKDIEMTKEQIAMNDLASTKELDYFSQKLFRPVEIDKESLKSIDAHFSSLEQIEDL